MDYDEFENKMHCSFLGLSPACMIKTKIIEALALDVAAM